MDADTKESPIRALCNKAVWLNNAIAELHSIKTRRNAIRVEFDEALLHVETASHELAIAHERYTEPPDA